MTLKTPDLPLPEEPLEKWKRIAKRPNAWFDRFQLLHPGPWQVVALGRGIDVSSLHAYSLLLATTTPLHMILLLGACRKQQLLAIPRSAALPIAGTLSIFCAWKIASPLYKLVTSMKQVLSSTSFANPAAWECLANRIEKGLAYRRRRFDVYLPPPPSHHQTSNDDQKNKTPKPFILFFPGAYVEHVALSQPASLLADAGHVVVVVSAEPIRLVDDRWWCRFGTSNIRSIQRAVERNEVHDETRTQPVEWVLAGHSMGSFLCTKLAPKLPNVRSIVMWGSAPFVDYCGDLSDNTSIRVLIVQATNDGVIAAFATPELWKGFWSRFPSNTKTVHEIQGGTHSGFANYKSQWKPEMDGIPVDQQHREAVDVTLRFLEGAQ